MKEWGERWSFIWLVIATLVIVLGALLVSDSLEKKAVEAIVVTIEHFEKGSGTVKTTNATQHVEELETGVIINADDLEVLTRIIYGESGSNWCSDQMQLYVGSVFLNRVKSKDFPNTFKEVAFQDGQYSCTHKGSGYWLEPNERARKTAEYLLINGSQLEPGYVWQSNFEQGTGIIKVQNMYFGKKG